MKRELNLSIIVKNRRRNIWLKSASFSQGAVIESPQVIQKEVPNKANAATEQETAVILQKLPLRLKSKGRVKLH